MKITYLLLIILLLTLTTCLKNKQRRVEYIYIYLEPQDNIKVLLDSFLTENGKDAPIYELYIQRITPWEYDKFESTITEITIYGGKYPLGLMRKKREPTVAVKIDGVDFFIYSGIEDYFSTAYKGDPYNGENEPYGNVWDIRDSVGVYTYFIKTTLQAPPPSDIPSDIKFVPPTIEE
ncbi:MAG: hypothetical protein LBN74_01745 [Prevotella sp.]|jgi:hypothetical protein|nr:hypothetical protein [Prevotella sp.]